MNRSSRLVSLVLVGFAIQAAAAQDAGEKVVVVRETKIKRDGQVVQTLSAGAYLRVEEVDGAWFWVCARNAGWIASADVATPDDAIDAFSKQIDDVPDDAASYVARGNAKLAAGQLAEAIADYNAALRLDSKNFDALLGRAQAQADERQLDQALADLRKAVELDRQSIDALFLRGTLLAEHGQFEKAAADLSECLGLCPEHAGAYRNRAALWLENHDNERAFADADRATELDPRNSAGFSARGAALLGLGKIDDALIDLDEALKLDPKNRHALIARGHAACHANDFERALADLTAALKLHRDAPAFVLRGDIHAELGARDKAIADYTSALKLNPRDLQALHSRSTAWMYLHDYGKALADVSEVLRQNPNDVSARRRRAFIRATAPQPRFRDGKQAVADALRACELTQWKQVESVSVLAAAYAEIGNFNKAVEFESQAIKLAADKDLRQALEQTLDLYKHGQPYRLEPGNRSTEPPAGRTKVSAKSPSKRVGIVTHSDREAIR